MDHQFLVDALLIPISLQSLALKLVQDLLGPPVIVALDDWFGFFLLVPIDKQR